MPQNPAVLAAIRTIRRCYADSPEHPCNFSTLISAANRQPQKRQPKLPFLSAI